MPFMGEEFTEDLNRLRHYYDSGATRSFAFRRDQLLKLKSSLLRYEKELYAALKQDLNKNPEESWVTEIGFVLAEINHALRHLKKWMKPKKVRTNLVNFPSKSYVLHEPLGVVFIIAPWNYPLQLLFSPLVGALAAGNCVVLKPSEFSPATARLMKKIIEDAFERQYILYVEGEGGQVVPAMMNNFRFNHIFYTGSTSIGKIIYKMAAEQLVPVTLELGGKSPCVVESDANLKVAGRRIVQTKFSNAGQMCVAPDYVLVQGGVRADLIESLKTSIQQFYTSDPSSSYAYGKIINEKQFDRLQGYLEKANILYGGKSDRGTLYIEPTLVEVDPTAVSNIFLKEEIFGPILPVISFDTFEDARTLIKRNPDPLAFYIFTGSKEKERRCLQEIPFGGGCVNNASWHLTNPNLPFGGRGDSGIGNYHGNNSFEVFSHHKAIMKTPTWFDPSIKYPPFEGKLGLFKKIIR
jgi:aldehyde dehydrogenase (NAD+)